MAPSSTSAASVVSHGAVNTLATHFSVIDAVTSHFDHVVKVHDSSAPVDVKAIYPAMSCVAFIAVMWSQTTTQSCRTEANQNFYTIYGAATEL